LSLRKTGRVWIEIRRPEVEHTYLEHQLRELRRLATSPFEHRMDLIPGARHYCTLRLRCRCDELLPAYQLLYPQDEFKVSRQALEVAGLQGLAALWLDQGRYEGHQPRITCGRWNPADWMNLQDHLDALGYPARVCGSNKGHSGVVLLADALRYPAFVKDIYPLAHVSLRHRLRRSGDRRIRLKTAQRRRGESLPDVIEVAAPLPEFD
jgi:hypothetical protein